MQKAHDIFEAKLSWKGVKKLEEAQQKFNTLLETEQWAYNPITKYYKKEEQVIEYSFSQLPSPNSTLQFQIGNVYYPVKKFEVVKVLLQQMILCNDIENLEIHDIDLKEIEKEFSDFLHEQSLGYNKGEWHTLKQ
ncbi:hypothetical protein [Butyricimonas sp.]|uniref:hypothetical protein n=1 Tax=Butyricimonas sp. TaxID=1969738 RepID=UPI0025B8DFDC|nr:hypothetical protein [Butyricimonas sp.]